MKKLILIIIISFLFTNTSMASGKLATLINPFTGQKKVVTVGDRGAFAGGFILMGNVGSKTSSDILNVLDSVSATTTSSVFDITGANRATLSFTVSNLAAAGKATSTFVVFVSVDGTNFATSSKLIDNVTNTISQNLTRVGSLAIDSNTTKILSLDLTSDIFKSFKVLDTITGTTTSIVNVKALID